MCHKHLDKSVLMHLFKFPFTNTKIVNQTAELPFERTRVESHGNTPVWMLRMQIGSFECQHDSLA